MKTIFLVAATVALAACSKPAAPPANDAADMTAANTAAATPAAFSINETSWEYTQKGKALQESVDASGKYITTSGTEHVDHGTVVMKDGKACFTSAMTKEGESCWSDPKVEIGQTGETVSDKGEKLQVKRVAYIPKTL